MKRKETAGILALFLGWAGIHRFYLGQVWLGLLYAMLMFSGISVFVGVVDNMIMLSGVSMVLGIIDAVVFLSMDQDTFDVKYNNYKAVRRGQTVLGSGQSDMQETLDLDKVPVYKRPDYKRIEKKPEIRADVSRSNPHKAEGIRKFRDYDYDGAIQEFLKALEIQPNDIATHFNLACAYSINELPDKAFEMLDKAVALGFDDFERIRTHESLAFLRIQPEYDTFEAKGFRLDPSPFGEASNEEEEEESSLLDQLKRLGELKEKGLLTEEEFDAQKKKLLK